jgi:hypothetical protein
MIQTTGTIRVSIKNRIYFFGVIGVGSSFVVEWNLEYIGVHHIHDGKMTDGLYITSILI